MNKTEIDFNLFGNIINKFGVFEKVENVKPITQGLINTTYLVETKKAKFVLQKINTDVFEDPDALMSNIITVVNHIKKHHKNSTLNYLKAEGGKYYLNFNNSTWRMYDYIDGVYTISKVENEKDFESAGRGFGEFLTFLSDLDGNILKETIPNFHNTPKRIKDLQAAAKADKKNRLAQCTAEFEEAMKMAKGIEEKFTLLCSSLPVRVTHNDTKISNILFDSKTNEARCVIDLDTIMPGLAMFDFGDAIRSGAVTVNESSKDIDRVEIDKKLFTAYAKGYLGACGNKLSEEEISSLAFGAFLMTYECAIRFLTDYINGDVYFTTEYDGQNLFRARNQLKLAQSIQNNMPELEEIILKIRPQ